MERNGTAKGIKLPRTELADAESNRITFCRLIIIIKRYLAFLYDCVCVFLCLPSSRVIIIAGRMNLDAFAHTSNLPHAT